MRDGKDVIRGGGEGENGYDDVIRNSNVTTHLKGNRRGEYDRYDCGNLTLDLGNMMKSK